MMLMTDKEENIWHKQDEFEARHNHGVQGVHASIPFQCEDCWMVNLENRLPSADGGDSMYVRLLRRANLDAMGSRAPSTIRSHAAAVCRSIKLCTGFGKTPTIMTRGPMPLQDTVGMGLAVEMLYHSIVAKPKLRGQQFIQYDSMRKLRSTFTQLWRSSPRGIAEGAAFAGGFTKTKATQCPSQSDWFTNFSQGAEARMGYTTQSNRPLHIHTISLALDLIKHEIRSQPPLLAYEYVKLGAAIVTALAGSLRGPEVFMLDLGGIRKHLPRGRDGVLPEKPMKTGVDLANAPHVHLALVGKFKGETGVREHLVAVASTTISGIEVRWWLERLIRVRELEGCTHGPAFGNSAGSVAYLSDYDFLLHDILKTLQTQAGSHLDADEDVAANYSFFRSFRKTAENRARAAGLDSDVQNAMNRWKKFERAKGRRPHFDMIDHYSDARELMPVTWRYSYAQ